MKTLYLCLTITCAIAMNGCNGDGESPATHGPAVMVSYQSGPLADVQVRLHEFESGPVLAQAVSASDGRAAFRTVPDPEPSEYCVSLQSIGDGGWILDAKYGEASKSHVRLAPLADHDEQTIELPRGAVRPLMPVRRQ